MNDIIIGIILGIILVLSFYLWATQIYRYDLDRVGNIINNIYSSTRNKDGYYTKYENVKIKEHHVLADIITYDNISSKEVSREIIMYPKDKIGF